ncbi:MULTISPECIES: GyrI-like domain-containing protein [unclassified Ornithinimicrobium]|uniref:GyrI-like domain-containing protein n=1 Tax=unclassified Ornithinimicrobium TaxID=2615080 RepID=UPI003853A906
MTDQPSTVENPEIITLEEVPTAVVAGTVRMDELGSFFDRGFGAVARVVESQGMGFQEAPFGYYLGMPTDTVDLEVGYVTDRPITPEGDVVVSRLPGGEAAHATHVGPYEGLGAAYGELASWVGQQGRELGPVMWEVYTTEPTPETDPLTLRTELYWPLA